MYLNSPHTLPRSILRIYIITGRKVISAAAATKRTAQRAAVCDVLFPKASLYSPDRLKLLLLRQKPINVVSLNES